MDDYLIDRQVLSKFVDELIKRHPLPVNSEEELNTLRENAIRKLDDRIGKAIFSRLSKTQNEEISQLMDREDVDESVFQEYFARAGVDLEKVIADTMQMFSVDFLGGKYE